MDEAGCPYIRYLTLKMHETILHVGLWSKIICVWKGGKRGGVDGKRVLRGEIFGGKGREGREAGRGVKDLRRFRGGGGERGRIG